jgi:hypothetical protein
MVDKCWVGKDLQGEDGVEMKVMIESLGAL